MRSREFAIVVACLWGVGIAVAQQAVPPDRKDYAIEAIQQQRNDANNREVLCRAEAGPALDALRAEVEKLKAELADARKAPAAKE